MMHGRRAVSKAVDPRDPAIPGQFWLNRFLGDVVLLTQNRRIFVI